MTNKQEQSRIAETEILKPSPSITISEENLNNFINDTSVHSLNSSGINDNELNISINNANDRVNSVSKIEKNNKKEAKNSIKDKSNSKASEPPRSTKINIEINTNGSPEKPISIKPNDSFRSIRNKTYINDTSISNPNASILDESQLVNNSPSKDINVSIGQGSILSDKQIEEAFEKLHKDFRAKITKLTHEHRINEEKVYGTKKNGTNNEIKIMNNIFKIFNENLGELETKIHLESDQYVDDVKKYLNKRNKNHVDYHNLSKSDSDKSNHTTFYMYINTNGKKPNGLKVNKQTVLPPVTQSRGSNNNKKTLDHYVTKKEARPLNTTKTEYTNTPLNAYKTPSLGSSYKSNNYVNFESIEMWKNMIEKLLNSQALMNYAMSRPKDSLDSLNELKNFMIGIPSNDDIEKAWVIYLWVTHNIGYDTTVFQTYVNYDVTPQKVFDSGVTIATGYSTLYQELCKTVGIKCLNLHGFAKGYSYEFAKKCDQINHSWNALEISGKWYNVECTWGAGIVTRDHAFFFKFEPYFFCTPTAIFVEQHFSQQIEYQISKLNLKYFQSMGYKKLDFFLYNVKCLSHEDTNLDFTSNPVELLFSAPKDIQLAGSLRLITNERKVNHVFIQRHYNTTNFEVNVNIPDQEQYVLELFATKGMDYVFAHVATYFIRSIYHPPLDYVWCKSYDIKEPVYLFKPLYMYINQKKKYEFKIFVEALQVALVDSNKCYTNFEKSKLEKNIWMLEKSSFPKGVLYLSVKFDSSGPFLTAFSYEVK